MLFLLPWMAFPYITHLINNGSNFTDQFMYHQFGETFPDSSVLHGKGETHPPMSQLYGCTHQLLCSHLTAEKIKLQRSDQPWATSPSTSPWYLSTLIIHTGPHHWVTTQHSSFASIGLDQKKKKKNLCAPHPESIQNWQTVSLPRLADIYNQTALAGRFPSSQRRRP